MIRIGDCIKLDLTTLAFSSIDKYSTVADFKQLAYFMQIMQKTFGKHLINDLLLEANFML